MRGTADILEPGWISGYATGSGHSMWNAYDAHIPLLWMGWGIRQGKTNTVYHMTDIAPTVAALLCVQEPGGNVGRPMVEALKHPLTKR